MKRESLVNIRTVREVVSSLDKARLQSFKTTNLLARGNKEPQPLVNQGVIAAALALERRRFDKRMACLERSQNKILKARQKLANTKEKNRQIMGLRLSLYKQYWKETSPVSARNSQAAPSEDGHASMNGNGEPGFKRKKLKYGGAS